MCAFFLLLWRLGGVYLGGWGDGRTMEDGMLMRCLGIDRLRPIERRLRMRSTILRVCRRRRVRRWRRIMIMGRSDGKGEGGVVER